MIKTIFYVVIKTIFFVLLRPKPAAPTVRTKRGRRKKPYLASFALFAGGGER